MFGTEITFCWYTGKLCVRQTYSTKCSFFGCYNRQSEQLIGIIVDCFYTKRIDNIIIYMHLEILYTALQKSCCCGTFIEDDTLIIIIRKNVGFRSNRILVEWLYEKFHDSQSI